MASKTDNAPYEAFACGRRCHPDRYKVFSRRTFYGIKRWGVYDSHMDVNLAKLCATRSEAESWRINLAMMELRERQYSESPEGVYYGTPFGT